MRHLRTLVAVCAVLASCSGGGDVERGALELADAVEPQQDQRRHALAVPAGVDPLQGANILFDFAEGYVPTVFVGHQTTRMLSGGIYYRHYPSTGAYIAVINWRVYAMGGALGPSIIDAGEVTDYVSVSEMQSPVGTITAGKLASCPNVSSAAATNFYLCMVGHLDGAQAFAPQIPCRLTIAQDGTLSLDSDGQVFTVLPAVYGLVSFSKDSTGLLALVSTASGRYPSVDFTIDSRFVSGGNFFVDGGLLDVDAELFDPRPAVSLRRSLSCTFTVPKF